MIFQSRRLATCLLGISRSQLGDDGFRERCKRGCATRPGFSETAWTKFTERLSYHAADAAKETDWPGIVKKLQDLCHRHGSGDNTLFYLSVAPELYEPIITNIGATGLVHGGKSWCQIDGQAAPRQRIIVEKPFGSDLASAERLNRSLGNVFDDADVFRIDHYLGKRTVGRMPFQRRAPALPYWRRLCSSLATSPIVARQSMWILRQTARRRERG